MMGHRCLSYVWCSAVLFLISNAIVHCDAIPIRGCKYGRHLGTTLSCSAEVPDCRVHTGPFLTKIEELTIENCNEYERNITEDATSCYRKLEKFETRCIVAWFQKGAFAKSELRDLRFLGGIKGISMKALCALHHLQTITIQSKIHPTEFVTGLSSGLPCPSTVSTLRVQHNNWTTLPPDLSALFPNLTVLDASENKLSAISSSVFAGLAQLQILNLGHNQISSVDPDSFRNSHQLTRLHLSFNRLSTLPMDVFKPLSNLEELHLDHNNLEAIGDALNGLPKLHLPNLTTLSLADNRIAVVGPQDLLGLPKLAKLNLNYNHLTQLEPDVFDKNPNLNEVELEGNLLTAIPKFGNQTRLQKLNLGNNSIAQMNEDSFEHLNWFGTLLLNNNEIQELTSDSIGNIFWIDHLDLSHNKIRRVDHQFLSMPHYIKELKLNHNLLTYDALNASRGFPPRTLELHQMTLSSNRLSSFEYSWFPNQLSWLDLSNNSISRLPAFNATSGILHFDLAHNHLTHLGPVSFVSSVRRLVLRSNRIATIDENAFFNLEHLNELDLSQNRLVKTAPFRFAPLVGVEVHVRDNPWKCDCTMDWLLRHKVGQQLGIKDFGDVTCSTPAPNILQRSVKVSELGKVVRFLCPFRQDPADKTRCAEPVLDPKCSGDYCPEACVCYHDKEWLTVHVDCSAKSLEEVPSTIASITMTLYLDSNRIKSVDGRGLNHLARLTKLYLNNSKVHSVAEEAFARTLNLEVLHLNENSLTDLPVHVFRNLSRLLLLDLSSNSIARLNRWLFAPLKSLQVLNLQDNNLKVFSTSTFSVLIGTLKELRLASNPWQCRCCDALLFGDWVEAQEEILKDFKHLECTLIANPVNPNGVVLALYHGAKWYEQYQLACYSNNECAL